MQKMPGGAETIQAKQARRPRHKKEVNIGKQPEKSCQPGKPAGKIRGGRVGAGGSEAGNKIQIRGTWYFYMLSAGSSDYLNHLSAESSDYINHGRFKCAGARGQGGGRGRRPCSEIGRYVVQCAGAECCLFKVYSSRRGRVLR
jgi:hypothetical protein